MTTTTPDKNKWKTCGKILGITAAIIASFMLILTIIAFACEDKIADLVLHKIYAYTTVDISHDKVSFSLIKRFPAASLEVNNLAVQEAHGPNKLLEARKVYLQCNLPDIISGNYTLRKVEISHARLLLAVNVKGENNWDIFIHQDTVSDNQFKIALNTIQLQQVDVSYLNAPSQVNVKVFAKKIQAKGDFDTAVFNADIRGNLLIDTINVKQNQLITRQNVELGTTMNINTKTEEYSFTHGDFKFDFLHFSLGFTLKKQKQYFHMHLQAGTQAASIKNLSTILPDSLQEKMSMFSPDGELTCQINMDGLLDNTSDLHMQAQYQLQKGKIANTQTNVTMSDISLKGDCQLHTADISHSLVVNVNTLTARLNKGYITAKASLEGLNQPKINVDAEATLQLNDWQNFMPANYIHYADGDAEIKISFNHQFADIKHITASDLNQSFMQGTVSFSHATLQLKDSDYTLNNLSGEVSMQDHIIHAKHLQTTIHHNTLELNGRVENLFPYLLDSNEDLRLIAYLNTESFSLDEFLKTDPNNTNSKKEKNSQMQLKLPQHIYMDLAFTAKEFTYKKFEAMKTSGRVLLNKGTLSLQQFEINTFDGKMEANCTLRPMGDKQFGIQCNTYLKHINIEKLFYATNNFGQQSLTYKNLQGTADCSAQITATLQNDMQLIQNSINAGIALKIENGKLINFKALESLSKFISINELNNIQFETLSTQISVANRTITIPQIEIRNNVLNLSIGGTHTFDNDIDYHIQLSLGELLSKKARANQRNREDFGEVIDDNTGKATLFLVAGGNLDKPVFKWDSNSSHRNMKQKWEEQKLEIQQEKAKKDAAAGTTSATPAPPTNKELNSTKKQSDLELDDNW